MLLVIYVQQLGVQINLDPVFVHPAMVMAKLGQHLDFFLLKDLVPHAVRMASAKHHGNQDDSATIHL